MEKLVPKESIHQTMLNSLHWLIHSLITNQNNLLRAKVQQLSNQYDYIFKMKVLEFYKGQGVKF
jgi:hypothetical protein